MRTACSSSHPGGGLHQAPLPLGAGTPPGVGTPLGAGTSPQDQPSLGPDSPQGPGTPPDQAPPRTRHPPRGQTHACKHITLPQTSFAGGKNIRNDITSVFSSEIKNFIKTTLVPNSQDDTNTDNVSSLNYRPQTKFGAR